MPQQPVEHTRQASRMSLARWRNPRLLLGIALVIASTLLAARWAAAQDDRVEYWSLRGDVQAGTQVSAADLVATRVRVGEGTGGHYLRVVDEMPAAVASLEWSHDGAAGELMRRASVRPIDSQPKGELPLKVAVGAFPDDLRGGQHVDVWVNPAQGETTGDSTRAFQRVRILSLGADGSSVGGSLATTVVVAIEQSADPAAALAAVSRGSVTLVRVP